MAQLMPLPLTVSCFSKIQIGFTFLVPAHPGIVPEKGPLNGCVCIGKKSMVFSFNCLSKIKDFSKWQAVTYIVEMKVLVGLSPRWRKMGTLLNLLLHTTYGCRLVPFQITFNDREGHLPDVRLFKCNSTIICATFYTVSTDNALRVVHRRQLNFLKYVHMSLLHNVG